MKEKKRLPSLGSLAFALRCSDGLRRKRSAVKQNYTHFTRVSKNKSSAFFSISDKSVPYSTLTSLPGVSGVRQEDVPHQRPSFSPCTPQWPKAEPQLWSPPLCPDSSLRSEPTVAANGSPVRVCLLWTQKTISSFQYKMEHSIKVWYNCFVRDFALKVSWRFWSGPHACVYLRPMLISRMALFCWWGDK